MKNIINRKNLLLAVTLLLAPAAQGQEYIKEVEDVSSDYSIIREYKEDARIIYSAYGDERQFLMVTESGTTTTLMNLLDEINVSDFEIMGDTLYFCGARYFNELNAVFGWMNLNLFPTNLHMDYFPDIQTLNNIEVFKSRYGGETHAVMTGDSRIVDARKTSILGTPWIYYYAPIDSTRAVFDDVAVTGDQVLASARTDTKHGYVYCYNHPAVGASFLISPAFKYHIGGDIMSRIILERCNLNCFATTCKRQDAEQNSVIEVRYYNGMIPHRIYYFNVFNVNQVPVDLKFYRKENGLDVLIHENIQFPYHSIYHFDSIGGLYKGRDIPDHLIYSLDYLKTDSLFFIASGRGNNKELRFFKYNPTYFKGKCSVVYDINSQEDIRRPDLLKMPIVCRSLERAGALVNRVAGEKAVRVRCYYDLKKDIEQ